MNVSIAMAAYNGERFIGAQLESLASQSHTPFEVVVCDDGSTDRTVEIVESFARTAPFPVRIEKNEMNLGYSENFFKAMRLCRGDLIAFCDQDDVWSDGKLAACVAHFKRPDTMMVYHGFEVVDESLSPMARFANRSTGDREYRTMTLPPWRCIPGFTMVFRRDLPMALSEVKRPGDHHRSEFPMAHDIWISFLATVFGGVVELGGSLALYRQHGANAMGAIEPAKGVGERLAFSARDWEAEFLMLSGVAGERARLLAAYEGEGGSKLHADAAARSYARLSRFLMIRAAIYRDRSPRFTRLGNFLRLVALGGYRRVAKGGLAVRALAKDGIYLAQTLVRAATAETREVG